QPSVRMGDQAYDDFAAHQALDRCCSYDADLLVARPCRSRRQASRPRLSSASPSWPRPLQEVSVQAALRPSPQPPLAPSLEAALLRLEQLSPRVVNPAPTQRIRGRSPDRSLFLCAA